MTKLKFDDLGTDIKALIVEKIFRPTDLKNLCLVNKEFHELAVKSLYYNVALDLGSSNDHRLSAFLSPKNIGLKHIKRMRLYLADDRDRCCRNGKQQAQLVSKMILEFLPEDTLEEFSWAPWSPFSTDNLLLLYKKQRNLRELEALSLDRDILPALKKNEKMQKEMFQHVRSLSLYPESRVTLRLCNFYVQKTRDVLEDLSIYTHFHEHHDPRDPSPHSDFIEGRELNDSATAPGLLTSTIFGSMMPFDKCEPLKNLRSLRLHRVSVRHSSDTWCKIIDFTKIEYLRIHHCTGADSFFGELSKASNLPRQLKTLEFQHKDNSENEALLAIDGFLCLTSGIRQLVIDLEHVKTLPAAAGIARHGKTLEILSVHCSPDCSSASMTSTHDETEEHVWDMESFEKICKACTSVEQLSCAWPQTSLIRSPFTDWKIFERMCSRLKKLVTLNISNWPNNKPSSQLLPRTIYEQLLQNLAQRTFEMAGVYSEITSSPTEDNDDEDDGDADANADGSAPSDASMDIVPPTSKLRVIAFGISDRIYEREDSKNQIIYLRSSCQDALGKHKAYAAPIGWNLCHFVQPQSSVLDFVLHRGARPPCREVRESGMGWGGGDDDESDM